jgi:hypothetical protein
MMFCIRLQFRKDLLESIEAPPQYFAISSMIFNTLSIKLN